MFHKVSKVSSAVLSPIGIGHGVAMTDFGGGIPDHCHNKAVANWISHGGRYCHVGVLTDIRDIEKSEEKTGVAAGLRLRKKGLRRRYK